MGDDVSAAFTPGPWAEDYCDSSEVWHVDAGSYPYGSTVCEVDQRTLREGTAEANASLIAAAPDMFSLLLQYADDLRYPPEGASRDRRLERVQRVIDAAQGQS